ncbi:putative toxin-antitoxin system antitoxin component [compost metagenome]
MAENFDERYAKMLERAERVLGGRKKAERWMLVPALGLEGRRPVDLLSNPDDLELLETFLVRIEYCVYH